MIFILNNIVNIVGKEDTTIMWTAPEVKEMNVSLTANGIFEACIETLVLYEKKEKDPKES